MAVAVFHQQDDQWYFDGVLEDTEGVLTANAERGFESKVFDLDAAPVEPV